MSQYKQIVTVSSADMTARIFGAFDANVRLVEAAFSVVVRNRSGAGAGEGAIVVEGADAKNVARAAQALACAAAAWLSTAAWCCPPKR